jgi:hypothetical protein
VAEFEGRVHKGWLISERFEEKEYIEIATKGPLKADGTWFWINMKYWKESSEAVSGKFSILIGDKRIMYKKDPPNSKEEAEEIAWTTTGLSPNTWKLSWKGRGLTGRLIKIGGKAIVLGKKSQDILDSVTPRRLPPKIQTPNHGWSAQYFEEKTGYPAGKVKLRVQGQLRTFMGIPKNTEIDIEYTPRGASDVRPIRIIWPDHPEFWSVNVTKFEEELRLILSTRNLAPEDGILRIPSGKKALQWPQAGEVYWSEKSLSTPKEPPPDPVQPPEEHKKMMRKHRHTPQIPEIPKQDYRGRGKSSPKGLPVIAARYTVGNDPILVMNDEELVAWLEDRLHLKIERNGEFWNYQTIEPGDHFDLWENKTEERDVICKDLETTVTVKKEEARVWLQNHEGMNIQRNHRSWDGKTVVPGDNFEALGRLRGGAGPRKYRDINSVKNFNARMARRKKIEAIARAEREKRHTEEELEDSIRYRSTSVNYEGEEFIAREFVKEEWNKQTSRRFARWV